jgi:hypothetical protein
MPIVMNGATQFLTIADPHHNSPTRKRPIVDADDHRIQVMSRRRCHLRPMRWLAVELGTSAGVETITSV